jgi:hydrogenase maturation protein HypF
MQVFDYKNDTSQQILALGPESNGNFSLFHQNKLYFSEDFGDLLMEKNFQKYRNSLSDFLKKNNFQPAVILTDLHPLYKTTLLGQKLSKKFKAQHIKIQHHLAHIFSAIGEKQILNVQYKISDTIFGIACDGTGYGTDDKIWGGEIFKISNFPKAQPSDFRRLSLRKIKRIGHLENQVMISGDLAIQEPARMLISILAKFLFKEEVYAQIKKYYSAQEFEVLYNQLQQNFNCIETSSTGRILDAVSLLLGFCGNERKHKHEPILKLEANSAKPYLDIKPKIEIINSNLSSNFKFQISNKIQTTKCQNEYHILNTTFLFEYLIENINKDKKRLAATAQLYIAEGLYEIISEAKKELSSFFAGGIANNKIISQYFATKKNIPDTQVQVSGIRIPRGDAGLSLGQIIFYLTR